VIGKILPHLGRSPSGPRPVPPARLRRCCARSWFSRARRPPSGLHREHHPCW